MSAGTSTLLDRPLTVSVKGMVSLLQKGTVPGNRLNDAPHLASETTHPAQGSGLKAQAKPSITYSKILPEP
jgi:hypothetical protein